MERQRSSGWLLVALAAGLRLAPLTGLGQADGFLASAEALLSGIESRYPGSPGNLELEGRVAARFAASGFAHGAVTFEAPTFIPGATSLVLGDDRRVALAPMHPTLLRPGNFPESSFDARLLYLGTGGVADLKAVRGLELKGVIAVMEFDCGDAWLRLLRFGVRGFVFLAPETFDRIEAELKVPDTEVAVPRFLAAAAASAMLRERLVGPAGRSALAVRVEAQPSVWENRKLRDLWAFIPGRDADLERTVVLFVAPMDANCVVPGQAAGGSAALNLSLLLDLLEQFRATPPAQSVMLVAVNAHTQGYLGERMLAWHLLASSGAVEDIRSAISRDIREQEITLAQYERIDFDDPAAQAEDVLIEFRRLEDRSTGRSVKIKNPVVAYAKRDVNRVKGKMLELQSNGDLTEDKLAARVAALKATLQEHINVLTLFNKVGIKTELSKLTPAEQVIVRGYIGTVRANFATWLKLNREALAADTANDAVREALGGRAVRLVIALDLSWHDRRMGFLSDGTGWSTRLGKNTVRIAADVAGETASPLLDTMSNVGGLGEGYYFPTTQSGLEPFSGTNTPGVSLRTAFDVATTAFTPADTLDAFDATRVQETADFLSAFFPALLADPKVTTVSELPSPKANPVWSVQIRTFKFDEFAASVLPELPVPGVLLQVARQSNPAAPALHRPFWGLGVVNRFFTLGDERATSVVYGLTSSTRAPTVAYRLDETFTHVDHTLDAGDVQEKVDSNLVPAIARTFALFECEEFPILNREDPSLISFSPITVPKYLILDAQQDSAPRKYGIAGIQSGFSSKLMPLEGRGPGAFYLPPASRVKILTSSKRPALNADLDAPEGRGFDESHPLDPDFFAAAADDLGVLNRYRLASLRGVSNELVDDYLARGQEHADLLVAARRDRDHLAYLKQVYLKLGSQVKAYEEIAGITNDMLKAIVFYMALLLPFCFFVQKLLFKFVKLELQLLTFAVLFVGTFVVFRMIHPAFRVAQAPEAIFIGFVMGVLGLFVISILHGRFEGEMQLLFMTYAGMDESQVGYSAVGQKAMLIGVNNMKRRRVRTSLTTTTIVLVTFTMLAFSSVSKKMSPTVVPVSKETSYNGLFYQWPGNLLMDEATLRAFRELVDDVSSRVIVRRWLMPASATQYSAFQPFPLGASNGRAISVDAALGLSTVEQGFLGPMPILPGGRFFSDDEAEEVVLPAAAAAALGLAGDDVGTATVSFKGHVLRLVGIMDDARFRALRDLNDRPILPIKDIQRGGASQSARDASVQSDPTADESGVFYVDASALLIVPLGTGRRMGAKPFSISIELKDGVSVWDAMGAVMTATRAKFYIGSVTPFALGKEGKRRTGAGIYYVGSGESTSIGGLTRLLIPLLIAATIILNTMLGAVYERKSEIAVYNAIGLNPTHIGLFFLAEAFVYSVIGSVGGYLIGQLLTIAITKFDLVQGINLNFSSLSVVYVILFTIAVVLLSTLYPAVVATRAAVPSGKRKWSMPPLDGNRMSVAFPFIYQPALARGAMAYLDEYFARFTEASVGELIARRAVAGQSQDTAGRETYTLVYDVALAPFDLGVTQDVKLEASYDEVVESYRINLTITRKSGQDSNWVTTNRPFLEKMRQYLMHWRNLEAVTHNEYGRMADSLFLS